MRNDSPAWTERLKDNPRLAKWSFSDFPFYKKMREIFTGSMATGEFAKSPLDLVPSEILSTMSGNTVATSSSPSGNSCGASSNNGTSSV